MLAKLICAVVLTMSATAAHAANVIEYTTPTTAMTLNADCVSVAQPIPPNHFIVNHFRLSNARGFAWEDSAISQAGTKGWVRIPPNLATGWYQMTTWSTMVDSPAQFCVSVRRLINLWPDINQHPSPALRPMPPRAEYYLW